MDFLTAGTLHSYTKSMSLKLRWKRDERNGIPSADPQPPDSGPDDKLKDIMAKVYAGSRLTREEKAYLKEKSPETCAQIEAAEQEDKAYQAELKRCRTKEDVQRVKTAHMGAALARVRDTVNNSAIPEEKKLQILTVEKYRTGKLDARTRKFIRSGEYAKLPTDAEKARVEKEEQSRQSARPDTPRETPPDTEQAEARPQEHRPATAPDVVRKVRNARRRTGRAAYEAVTEDVPDAPGLDSQA